MSIDFCHRSYCNNRFGKCLTASHNSFLRDCSRLFNNTGVLLMALPNHEGKRVPNVSFPVRVGNDWKTVTTDDLFKGKTVVVFSLPGAFTPTCSSTHLPRYNELAPAFKANGVDDILCVSVNDTFVMN